jgi:hypothetical protein
MKIFNIAKNVDLIGKKFCGGRHLIKKKKWNNETHNKVVEVKIIKLFSL